MFRETCRRFNTRHEPTARHYVGAVPLHRRAPRGPVGAECCATEHRPIQAVAHRRLSSPRGPARVRDGRSAQSCAAAGCRTVQIADVPPSVVPPGSGTRLARRPPRARKPAAGYHAVEGTSTESARFTVNDARCRRRCCTTSFGPVRRRTARTHRAQPTAVCRIASSSPASKSASDTRCIGEPTCTSSMVTRWTG